MCRKAPYIVHPLILEDLLSEVVYDKDPVEGGIDLRFEERGSPTEGLFRSFSIGNIPSKHRHSLRGGIRMTFKPVTDRAHVDFVHFGYAAFHYIHQMLVAHLPNPLRKEVPETPAKHVFASQ